MPLTQRGRETPIYGRRQAKIAAEEEARYRARVEAALKETAPGLLESEEDDEDEEERERRLAEERPPFLGDYVNYVRRVPLGVCG